MDAESILEAQLAPGEAIDRDHLRRMTLSDGALEREVLQLFDAQAENLIGRMRAAEPQALRALAHALKGSARGIGAWRVAQAAAALDELEVTQNPKRAAALDLLAAAVAEARAQIAKALKAA